MRTANPTGRQPERPKMAETPGYKRRGTQPGGEPNRATNLTPITGRQPEDSGGKKPTGRDTPWRQTGHPTGQQKQDTTNRAARPTGRQGQKTKRNGSKALDTGQPTGRQTRLPTRRQYQDSKSKCPTARKTGTPAGRAPRGDAPGGVTAHRTPGRAARPETQQQKTNMATNRTPDRSTKQEYKQRTLERATNPTAQQTLRGSKPGARKANGPGNRQEDLNKAEGSTKQNQETAESPNGQQSGHPRCNRTRIPAENAQRGDKPIGTRGQETGKNKRATNRTPNRARWPGYERKTPDGATSLGG